MPEPKRSWLTRGLLWVGLVAGTATVAVVAPTASTDEEDEPAATAGAADACGPTVLKEDGTPWVCTFADGFDGDALDPAKWVGITSEASGNEEGGACFLGDRPENVQVADGVLRLIAREEPEPFTCNSSRGAFETTYTGASVATTGRFSQAFGRWEIRAKVPAPGVPGLQEALWLWPDDPLRYGPWPISGEIDIAEGYSVYSDRMIPFIHYWPATTDWNVTNNWCLIPQLATEFHTYLLEWDEERLRISYDGQVCIEDHWDPAPPLEKPQPFDHPFFIALTQNLGVTGTNNEIQPGVTPLPAVTEVDHVRVWR